MIFRFLIDLAWMLVPQCWCWYREDSLERDIYESIRRASIGVDRLRGKMRWQRVEMSKAKGTPR